jgi:hypothetical protein
MFEVEERICFQSEDKFIVIGPCGNGRAVYTTHPTKKGAQKIADRMNAKHEIENKGR